MSMNVLFVITSLNKGTGGHFYSLCTIVEELKNKGINPIVVCIGESPVIEKGNFTKFIYPISLKISIINGLIKVLVNKYNIELIHLFDYIAYRYVMGIRKPHIQTKCGGPYNRFIPNSKYITVFSNENLEDLKYKNKFRNTTIEFIPNRIKDFNCDSKRLEKLKEKISYEKNTKYILRICRISSEYEKSIRQGFNLTMELNRIGIKTKFIVIGDIYNKVDYAKFKSDYKGTIWLTDSLFTHNAKELIDFCDIYLGTGRGVMEASKCKKIIMIPTNNSRLPALLEASNFEVFFNKNFSQRLDINIDERAMLNKISLYLNGQKNKETLFQFYVEMFDKYFNIEKASDKYIEFYQQAIADFNGKKISLGLFYKITYIIYHKYLIVRYAGKS